jgi:hypothetical protein
MAFKNQMDFVKRSYSSLLPVHELEPVKLYDSNT